MTTTKRESALPREEMDRASQERIKNILSQEPNTLSVADQGFINSRADYLTKEERKDFVNEIEEEEEEEEEKGDQYEAMNSEALKAELKKRELAVGGKVDELRARLREDDTQE